MRTCCPSSSSTSQVTNSAYPPRHDKCKDVVLSSPSPVAHDRGHPREQCLGLPEAPENCAAVALGWLPPAPQAAGYPAVGLARPRFLAAGVRQRSCSRHFFRPAKPAHVGVFPAIWPGRKLRELRKILVPKGRQRRLLRWRGAIALGCTMLRHLKPSGKSLGRLSVPEARLENPRE